MERRWLLIAHRESAELIEEGPDRVLVLFRAFRGNRESSRDYGFRIASALNIAAEHRAFDELEIFANFAVLGSLRAALSPRCASRLVAASNTLDLPRDLVILR